MESAPFGDEEVTEFVYEDAQSEEKDHEDRRSDNRQNMSDIHFKLLYS